MIECKLDLNGVCRGCAKFFECIEAKYGEIERVELTIANSKASSPNVRDVVLKVDWPYRDEGDDDEHMR